MKIRVQIEGKVVWKWGRTKEGNYIAICDPLAQTVQAKRFSDLLETINEALDSTMRELLSTGDLGLFLSERGWKSQGLPITRSPRNVSFEMPYDLKGVRQRDLQAALC